MNELVKGLVCIVLVTALTLAYIALLSRDLRPPPPKKVQTTMPPTPILWVPLIGRIDAAALT